MKILIFEYITGGGLAKQPLPESLLCEGEMMSRALIEDLLEINDTELIVTRDYRLPLNEALKAEHITAITITPESDIDKLLLNLANKCDAVWPIAPETDDTLYNVCRLFESSNTALLSSCSDVVKIAGDKMATYQLLKAHGIPVVQTYLLNDKYDIQKHQSWLIKPIDGVGCEGVRKFSRDQITTLPSSDRLILQPFIEGRSLSLSCLFFRGQGQLICVNEQLIKQSNGQFLLEGCEVNINIDKQMYLQLVAQIAIIMPMLWGYIGIDLIEIDPGPLVLEINPRLTTSYTGIKSALGVNIAACVLDLINNKMAELKFSSNKQIAISISGAASAD